MDLATRLGPWSAGPGPLHRKLAAALVGAIERGEVAAGERLPAERTLARSLAVSRAAGRLVGPRGTVLVENPSFSGTLDALRVAGARLVPVPTDDDGADVDALADLLDRTSPAAVYVMPSFHNPTGVQLTESRR